VGEWPDHLAKNLHHKKKSKVQNIWKILSQSTQHQAENIFRSAAVLPSVRLRRGPFGGNSYAAAFARGGKVRWIAPLHSVGLYTLGCFAGDRANQFQQTS
jgi:hypothetical protein